LEEEVKRSQTSIASLEKERQTLQEQLADAKSSLKAAARLTSQLDSKSLQIESLQNEGNPLSPLTACKFNSANFYYLVFDGLQCSFINI
jgi:hypothetical protein